MPYKIKRNDDEYEVVKVEGGKVMGTHPSRTKARAQIRALYASEANKSDSAKQAMTRDEVLALIQDLHDISMELGATCGEAVENEPAEDETTEGEGEQPIPEVGTEEYAAGTSASGQARNSRDEMSAMHQEQQAQANEEQPGTEPRPGYSRPQKGVVSVAYIKSLHVPQPEQFFRDVVAVKATGKDTIRGYLALWGNPEAVDIETEFFTGAKSPFGPTDFWDNSLALPRPLTWAHGQDAATKNMAQVGTIVEYGDDDIGRWYTAQLDLAHRYRKAIDKLVSQRAAGTSSDSAPQYVIRQPVGKGAVWLKQWPLFAAALTMTPCEPRQIGSVDYFKSLGIDLGELALGTEAAQQEQARRAELEKRVQSLVKRERELRYYV
jgi:hypothetical protein